VSRTIRLPFGKKFLRAELRADRILPRRVAGPADEHEAVRQALEQPIATPPLAEIVRPRETVAILVNDVTRLARTDLMLPPLVATLNQAGVRDEDILVVYALGNHRPQTEAERRRLIGEGMFQRLRTLEHDARDEANLVTVGRTSFGNVVQINRRVLEVERIILTGEIIHHLIAGYSGGRKSVVPGVAGFNTTTYNHRMILDSRCRSGVLEGNPAHEDMLEGCRMVEPDFMVNLVLTPAGKLVRVVAGHYDLAHREGCRAVDAMLRVEVDQPYDLVVASAGGHPLDIDLRQAHKGLENACRCLRPGGAILYYAECVNGAGSGPLEEFLWRYGNPEAMERALHENFVIGGHKAWWLARLGRRFDVHLVSRLDAALVRRCGFESVPPEEHAGRLRELLGKAGTAARVAAIPGAGFTLPALRGEK